MKLKSLIVMGLIVSCSMIFLTSCSKSEESKADGSKTSTKQESNSDVVECTTEDCFNVEFKECNPATLEADLSFVAVKYETFGPEGDGCSTYFEYTKNPNPEWEGKPMTCEFDNSVEISKSVENILNDIFAGENTYNCEGPLVAVLKSVGNT